MTGILVDTYAWIEIFRDSPWGRQALEHIEGKSSLAVSVLTCTTTITVGGVIGEEKTGSLIATIQSHAEAIPVDTPIAVAAGSIKSR